MYSDALRLPAARPSDIDMVECHAPGESVARNLKGSAVIVVDWVLVNWFT